MSLSKPSEGSRNPATRFFDWAGSKGQVKYYDKEAKETVLVPLDQPFIFIVLDQLSTVVGFSDALKSGYWANEVRSTQSDKIVVRSKKGIEFEGLYEKKDLPQGAKFATSVYIAYKDAEGVLKLGNIKFSGAAISAWIDFTKSVNVLKYAVAITGSTSGKKGAVEFEIPTFEKVEIDEKTWAAAVKLDEELQEYLEPYLKAGVTADHNRNYVGDMVDKAVEDAKADPEIRDLDAEKAAEPEVNHAAAGADAKPAPAKLPLDKIKF